MVKVLEMPHRDHLGCSCAAETQNRNIQDGSEWNVAVNTESTRKTTKQVKRMVCMDGKESFLLSQTEDPIVFVQHTWSHSD